MDLESFDTTSYMLLLPMTEGITRSPHKTKPTWENRYVRMCTHDRLHLHPLLLQHLHHVLVHLQLLGALQRRGGVLPPHVLQCNTT